MRTIVSGTAEGLFHALLQPSKLVTVSGRQTDQSIQTKIRQARSLLVVYLLNLILYAGPLTLAGIGIRSTSTVPDWLQVLFGSDQGLIALYLAGFIRNSVYMFGFTLAALAANHFALVITGQSKGFLRTAYSVVYSASVYLAGIFTVVWYLTTADGAETARNFVLDLQVIFIYSIIDYIGASVTYRVPRPDQVVTTGFSQVGEVALVTLSVLTCYFFYSLYLGARLNHDAGRYEGVVTILIVFALPFVYVFGSIIVSA